MQKWNLLKKTAPCILSLAVAATTFPTAVMASDLDAAVVSEAEAGDTEDFGTEETAEDTEVVAEEAYFAEGRRDTEANNSSFENTFGNAQPGSMGADFEISSNDDLPF